MAYVPMLKIFLYLIVGVLITYNLPTVVSTICTFVAIILSIFFTIKFEKFNTFWALILCSILGASLKYIQSRPEPPLYSTYQTKMVCQDTTSKSNIFICNDINTKSDFLLIVSNKMLKMPQIGDTISATVNVQLLYDAHYTIKKLASKKDIKYLAKVLTNTYNEKQETIVYGYHILPTNFNSGNYNKNKNNKANKEDSKEIDSAIKNWVKERLSLIPISSEDFSVLNGMIMGERKLVAKEKVKQYRDSGLSHYLAISGMHISILFMILNVLLFWTRGSYRATILKTLLIILIVWFYTYLVGMPISAVRAAVMFSMMQIMMIRITSPYQIYNTLFTAATVMILFNRTIFFDIGFQLSFMAVLSILIYMPIFNSLLPDKKLIRIILAPLILTISAQILTTPLTIYYFGYFSTLSVVTNLIATIILVPIFIISILFIVIPLQFLGTTISWLFNIFNNLIDYINSQSISVIDNIMIDKIDLIILIISLSLLPFLCDKENNLVDHR